MAVWLTVAAAGLGACGDGAEGDECRNGKAGIVPPSVLETRVYWSLGSIGTECPAVDDSGRFSVRLRVSDHAGSPQGPDATIGACGRTLGDALQSNELSIFDDEAVVFPVPPVRCAPDASPGDACPNAELRDVGFLCRAVAVDDPADVPVEPLVCALPGVGITPVRDVPVPFIAPGARERDVLLMIANGTSTLGLTTDGVPDRGACSTDPNDWRTRGGQLLALSLARHDADLGTSTRLCVAALSDGDVPEYRSPDGLDSSGCMQPAVDPTGDGFLPETLSDLGVYETVGTVNLGRAVLDGVSRVGDWERLGADRHIIVATDGDGVAAALGGVEIDESRSALLEAANVAEAEGVRLHVVRWDRLDRDADCAAPLTAGVPQALRDAACRTGGTFQYTASPGRTLSSQIAEIANGLAGYFVVPLSAPALAGLPAGNYELEFALQADLEWHGNSVWFASENDWPGSNGRALVVVGD